MKHTSTWKSTERHVARALNGQRMGPGGDRADVRTAWLTVEVKHRKTLPEWLKGAVAQAVKYAEPLHTTLPIAVLHEEGKHDSYVVLRLSDFRDWFGNLPDNWHDRDDRELPF